MKKIKDERYWNRKHSKGTEKFIECAYWACPYQGIKFHIDNFKKIYTSTRSCTINNFNLDYWWGSNAPNWCPRRAASFCGPRINM